MRNIDLAARDGLPTETVLSAERACVFKDIGSDFFDGIEHGIGELADFPLSLETASKLEEMKEFAGVHGKDKGSGRAHRQGISGVFLMDTVRDGVFVKSDGISQSIDGHDAIAVVLDVALGTNGEGGDPVTSELRETDATDAFDGESE